SPRGPAGEEVALGGGQPWSLREWQEADRMWRRHGEANALSLDADQLRRLREDAQRVPSLPTDLEGVTDPTVLRAVRARLAEQFYHQNRSVTNFAYFLAQAEAEANRDTVEARKVLWKADQARKSVA